MSKTRYIWWGYVKNMIRRYPARKDRPCAGNDLREREAVERAVRQTMRLDNGQDRLRVVELVFWQQTHTLEGAAMMVPCSERTARRWHTEFIRLVAREYGLLE